MKREEIISKIRLFPTELENFCKTLSNELLDKPIRSDGWTFRQSIHHLVDSHTHSYIRIKFALTEDNPEVKPYEEKDWSKLIDAVEMPIQVSLDAIRGIHGRLSYLLERIREDEWHRTLFQPELGKVELNRYCERLAVHGESHLNSLKSSLEQIKNR